MRTPSGRIHPQASLRARTVPAGPGVHRAGPPDLRGKSRRTGRRCAVTAAGREPHPPSPRHAMVYAQYSATDASRAARSPPPHPHAVLQRDACFPFPDGGRDLPSRSSAQRSFRKQRAEGTPSGSREPAGRPDRGRCARRGRGRASRRCRPASRGRICGLRNARAEARITCERYDCRVRIGERTLGDGQELRFRGGRMNVGRRPRQHFNWAPRRLSGSEFTDGTFQKCAGKQQKQ